MKKLLLNLQFVFKPEYWLMNYPYNKVWDLKLNKLMDNHDFTEINNRTAKLGDTLIWTDNIPYATMLLYTDHLDFDFRASRLTIKRAINKLNDQILIEKTKKDNYYLDKIN